MKKLLSAILLVSLLIPMFSFGITAAEEAATFDGAVHMLETAFSTTPNTFEAWIRFDADFADSDRGGVLIGNYGVGNSVINFEIHQNGKPRIYWVDSTGKVTDTQFSKVDVRTGEFVHLAIVRDTAEGKFHCYFNGEKVQSVKVGQLENILSNEAMVFGGDRRSGNSMYFKGEIRSLSVYAELRTEDEIAADMNTPGNGAPMVHFEPARQTTDINGYEDLSGNSNDALYYETWLSDKQPIVNYAYSFVAVGDTQVLSDKYPDKLSCIYDYILDNKDEKKIKFVFGLGDITERDTIEEWDNAEAQIKRLDGVVRYNVVRGNHDGIKNFSDYFMYHDYKDSYGGSYDGSMLNAWQTLRVGAIDYLMLTLDYGAADNVLEWAGEVIAAHPQHNVIITTHAYLYRDGTTLDQNDVCPPATTGGYNNGDHMWDKLIKKYKNIVLVMNGHDPCDRVVMTQTEGDHGNIVTQMLIDPQGVDAALGATGMITMLYFSDDGRNVTVETYSTVRERYFMPQNQFTMELNVIESANSIPDTEPVESETEGETAIEGGTTAAPSAGIGMLPAILGGVVIAAVFFGIGFAVGKKA